MNRFLKALVIAGLGAVSLFSVAFSYPAQLVNALPFNDDMVLNPMKTGRVMRQLPKGSISQGNAGTVETREEATKLGNPIKGDTFSAAQGERLFKINCSPCHGDISIAPYVPGTVAKYIPGPNLLLDLYHEKPTQAASGAGKSDGYIYATIDFGSISTLMPAMGYKLSPTEHWDIINYIRAVQKAEMQESAPK